MRLRLLLIALVATSMIGFSACGGNSVEDSAPETVTVVETEQIEDPPPETVTVMETETVPDIEVEEGDGSDPAGNIVVPDVVGMDHQLAQDTMQAAGLYNLAEEDATGQDRMLLFDRNWVVVAQDPPAGTLVTEDKVITLRSKKDDE
jgi:beta-lactam-binding protein with PASTA domain